MKKLLLPILLLMFSLKSAEYAAAEAEKKTNFYTLRGFCVDLHKANLLSVANLVELVEKYQNLDFLPTKDLQIYMLEIMELAKNNYNLIKG